MGIFYTLNVFIMQFYLGMGVGSCNLGCLQLWCTTTSRHVDVCVGLMLCAAGTTRLQLANKGDDGTYTDFANIVVAFAFFAIPVIGWLLDKKVRRAPCGSFAWLAWPGASLFHVQAHCPRLGSRGTASR